MDIVDDKREFELLQQKIKRDRGFNCSLYKDKCQKRRIAVRMRANKVSSYREYMNILDKNPDEYDKLLDSLTINVTEFFRNPETFDFLYENILPELIAEKRFEAMTSIRIWSAGCAAGEEPYSLAILLKELLSAKKRESYNIKIWGTDIDDASIERARNGVYQAYGTDNLSPNLLSKYFSPGRRGEYILKDEIKKMVDFRKSDLISEMGPTNLDMILCRNVVIYFSRELQERLFLDFLSCLRAGGYLVLGKVETLVGRAVNLFERVNNRERVFRKRLS